MSQQYEAKAAFSATKLDVRFDELQHADAPWSRSGDFLRALAANVETGGFRDEEKMAGVTDLLIKSGHQIAAEFPRLYATLAMNAFRAAAGDMGINVNFSDGKSARTDAGSEPAALLTLPLRTIESRNYYRDYRDDGSFFSVELDRFAGSGFVSISIWLQPTAESAPAPAILIEDLGTKYQQVTDLLKGQEAAPTDAAVDAVGEILDRYGFVNIRDKQAILLVVRMELENELGQQKIESLEREAAVPIDWRERVIKTRRASVPVKDAVLCAFRADQLSHTAGQYCVKAHSSGFDNNIPVGDCVKLLALRGGTAEEFVAAVINNTIEKRDIRPHAGDSWGTVAVDEYDRRLLNAQLVAEKHLPANHPIKKQLVKEREALAPEASCGITVDSAREIEDFQLMRVPALKC